MSSLVPNQVFRSDSPTERCAPSRNLARSKIVLVSNQVMHYRVSVYNYFSARFRQRGFEWTVIADRLQKENQRRLDFQLRELPFAFREYKQAISADDPAAVILFLHLKDRIIWPLMHWLKLRRIPFAFWTKGGNWDARQSRLRYEIFNYVHALSDALLLYSESCKELIKPRFRSKAFVANNTVNFDAFPRILESKDQIKKEFGIPFQKTVIFMGRMGEGNGRKRVDRLIELFRGLDRQGIGLVLVGSGLSDELKSKLDPRNMVYLGEVQDPHDVQISKVCKMADLCIIPGHLGLAVNQAFYWGLPVITEEDNHPPELAYLKPGRNGYIVPSGDTACLREHMLQLLDNDLLRAEFSRNAREDILKEASIEAMFSGFRACVDFLTARDRRSPRPVGG